MVPFDRVLRNRLIRASLLLASSLASLLLGPIGCSSGGTSQQPPATASIVTQPADATAQVGQTATFTVVAQGTGILQYQWYRDGVAISSANSASYTTPPLTSADMGDAFSVVVSNSVGQVTSRSAALNLGPRSPLPGDLRFQQVDAPTTAPGYSGVHNGTITYPTSLAQASGWGTPLSLGPGCVGDPSAGPAACKWVYFTFSRTGLTGISAGYTNQPASDLDSFVSALGDSTVLNGVAIDRGFNSGGFSSIFRSDVSGFAVSKQTVAPADLATALTASGTAGAVPTAISPDNGNVTFYAYTWKSDSATYDVQLQRASSSTVLSAATSLAQSGYIITASGGAGDNLFLVGTRVHGDTVPRPILIIQAGQSPQPLADGGYSTVALAADSNGNVLWYIGEK